MCDFPSSSQQVKGDIDCLALSCSGVSLADVWLHSVAVCCLFSAPRPFFWGQRPPRLKRMAFHVFEKSGEDDAWAVVVQVACGKLLVAPMKWLKFKHAECILPHLKQKRCYCYCALLTFIECCFLFRGNVDLRRGTTLFFFFSKL